MFLINLEQYLLLVPHVTCANIVIGFYNISLAIYLIPKHIVFKLKSLTYF